VGLWLPDRVENMIAELRKGAAELDNFLGLILSVQIMHDLFIKNPCVGDPGFFMVDNTPDTTHISVYPGLEYGPRVPKIHSFPGRWALEWDFP
jgi:hypothetical protein